MQSLVDSMMYEPEAYWSTPYYQHHHLHHRHDSSPPSSDSLEPFTTMIAQAAATNDYRRLEEIYEAYPTLSLDFMDGNGHTALMYASMNGHIASVKKLIELQANVDLQNLHTGDTALHFAAQCGHTRTAELLVRDGHANTGIKNYKGKTAFELARDFGHGENKVMKRLFESGPTAAEALRAGDSDDSIGSNENSEPTGNKKRGINKNESILPCHQLLKKFAETGCYCYSPGEGLGLMLLARNGSPESMVAEASRVAQAPDPKSLIQYLNGAVANFDNDRLFMREWNEIGELPIVGKARQDALSFYHEWRADNLKKLKSMISFVVCNYN